MRAPIFTQALFQLALTATTFNTSNRRLQLWSKVSSFPALFIQSTGTNYPPRDVRGLNLGKEDLKQRGRHPAFGVVTLSQLLSTWAIHDLTHLHQISRIMAHQYSEAVGPWKEYLGVLQCTGHGSI